MEIVVARDWVYLLSSTATSKTFVAVLARQRSEPAEKVRQVSLKEIQDQGSSVMISQT